MPIYIAQSKAKLYIGSAKVKKAYIGSVLIYSSGNTVTYNVDVGVRYQEEVGEGESCLSPKTFVPTKAGWTFVGWRADGAASGSVISSLVMGDSPIELNAVFAHSVTVTYYNGSTSASSQTKYRYWNNGNAAPPSFALTQAALSGWTARGWSDSAAANGGITYANGATFTRAGDITLYGMYQQAVTLSYSGNGATGGSTAAQTGYRYYNSNGQILNASFTLRANGFSLSGGTWLGWSTSATASSGAAAGSAVTLAANTTYYAVWRVPKVFLSSYADTWHGISWSWISGNGTNGIRANTGTIYGSRNTSSESWTFVARSSVVPTANCTTLTMLGIATNNSGQDHNEYVKVYNQSGALLGQIMHSNWNNGLLTVNLSGSTGFYIQIAAHGTEWTSGGAYIQFTDGVRMA